MGSINIPLSTEDEATLKALATSREASDAGIAQADRGEFLDDAAADAFFARLGASD